MSDDKFDNQERRRIEEQIHALSKAMVRRPLPTSAGDSLCFRCQYAHIYKRRAKASPVILCTALTENPRMPDDIEECSEFRVIGKLTDEQLMGMAVPISDREYKGDAGYR